jgi:hypothetical protein
MSRPLAFMGAARAATACIGVTWHAYGLAVPKDEQVRSAMIGRKASRICIASGNTGCFAIIKQRYG